MKIALALFSSIVFPALARAQDPPPPEPDALVIVPRVTVFYGDLRGKVRADEGTVAPAILDGTSVTFHSDLGIEDPEPQFMVEVVAFQRTGRRYFERAALSYLDVSYEGSSTLDSPEDFNGRSFAAGTAVDSDIRYRSWGADFSVFSTDSAFESASSSFLVGARYVDILVDLKGGGHDTDETLRLFYLGLGFRGETRFGPWLTGLLQASGYLSFGGFDDSHDFEFQEYGGFIFEGSIGISGAIGPLQLEAGWRYHSNSSYNTVDSDEKFEENDFIFEIGGPYLSATLRF